MTRAIQLLLTQVTVLGVLSGPVEAEIIFSDNFDTEPVPTFEHNYTGFANWTVTSGTVDILDYDLAHWPAGERTAQPDPRLPLPRRKSALHPLQSGIDEESTAGHAVHSAGIGGRPESSRSQEVSPNARFLPAP